MAHDFLNKRQKRAAAFDGFAPASDFESKN
jgi:hypothetical protein